MAPPRSTGRMAASLVTIEYTRGDGRPVLHVVGLLDSRHAVAMMERGTIESWSLGSGQWYGVIRADNGDRVLLFYWSVVQGFNQLRVGRQVEFSRMVGLNGLERNVASLAVPVLTRRIHIDVLRKPRQEMT